MKSKHTHESDYSTDRELQTIITHTEVCYLNFKNVNNRERRTRRFWSSNTVNSQFSSALFLFLELSIDVCV